MRNNRFSLQALERAFLFLFMTILVVIACVFYKERILFNDTLKCISDMFYKDGFNVTSNRYIILFSEPLPLLAFKAGWSLKAIIFLFSLNLILLPVILSLLSMYWFRETRTAWTILLFYVLMAARLFYYPISEFQYGLGFLLFYIGFYEYATQAPGRVKNWLFWLISLFFIPTVIFSHPLSPLVFFAWVPLHYVLHREKMGRLAAISLLAGIFEAVKLLFFNPAHDTNKAQSVSHFKTWDWSYLDGRLANGFYKALRDDYFLVPVLLVLAVIALIYWRKYLGAVLLLGIVGAFWLLVTVSLKDEPYWYYSEHIYQPVTFFIALAGGRYLPEATSRRFYFPLLALIALVSLNKVYLGHESMSRRLDWYKNCFQLMETKGITKGIVGIDRMDIDWRMEANWWTQYESAFLDAMDHPGTTTRTVTMVWNEETARAAINQGHNLIGVSLDYWPISDLPKQYFHLDTSHYVILADTFGDQQVRRLSYEKPRK